MRNGEYQKKIKFVKSETITFSALTLYLNPSSHSVHPVLRFCSDAQHQPAPDEFIFLAWNER